MNLRIFDEPGELALAAARDFAERAAAAIAERGRFAVALAGGSTPKATYEVLARDYSGSLDWEKVHFFFGDERTVPPDHEDSNFRMARETLLDHVPAAGVHRMRGELQPEEAAALYEEELKEFFGDTPEFDLILLGIGDDGHTASLFPWTPALGVAGRLTVANFVEKLDTVRLTLTTSVLNNARAADFLVAGESKARALAEILEGDADPRKYPAKLIRPRGETTWFLDHRAASRLVHK
jgi:6-phosphogluconolactonase